MIWLGMQGLGVFLSASVVNRVSSLTADMWGVMKLKAECRLWLVRVRPIDVEYCLGCFLFLVSMRTDLLPILMLLDGQVSGSFLDSCIDLTMFEDA